MRARQHGNDDRRNAQPEMGEAVLDLSKRRDRRCFHSVAADTLLRNALRIDLQDPDIRLMLTPPVTNNYVTNQRETLLQTPSEFLIEHDLQVAINAVYFDPAGYNNPSGTPAYLTGLAISEGQLVSVQTSPTDSESAMLFTTNNQATFVSLNWPATCGAIWIGS